MKVYFMRHGESEYNIIKRINFDPKKKVHLTIKGKDQVEKTARELRNMRFDAIYSSQFLRARESAEIMAKNGKIKIKVDKRLNEMRYGLEGESAEKYYEARKTAAKFSEFKIGGFESFLDVKERVYDFLMELRKKKYARVLVVTHEAVVQAARALFNQLGDDDAFLSRVRNAEYFMFDM
mgnify:CR=1 FL=1